MDYAYIEEDKNKSDEEKGMPILIIQDKETGMTFARIVPNKGKYPYAIHAAVKDIDSSGYSKVQYLMEQMFSLVLPRPFYRPFAPFRASLSRCHFESSHTLFRHPFAPRCARGPSFRALSRPFALPFRATLSHD